MARKTFKHVVVLDAESGKVFVLNVPRRIKGRFSMEDWLFSDAVGFDAGCCEWMACDWDTDVIDTRKQGITQKAKRDRGG